MDARPGQPAADTIAETLAMTTTAKLTLDEFLRLPETEPASEYDHGEVHQKTMPTVWHGLIQRLLSFAFTLYLRHHPIGDAGSEIRCVFGPAHRKRGYIPDYIFIVGAPGFGQVNGPYLGAPDLAVEILSPDDRMTRVNRKLRVYLRSGVRLVWLIDPERRTVTVLSPSAPARTLREQDELDGGDVLPDFRVIVRDLLPPAPAADV